MGEQQRAVSRARRAVASLAVLGLLLGAVVALSPPAVADTAPTGSTPATVSADALPTVQQNGVVWSQVTVGNIVYATGSFSQTWPAGQAASSTNETPRANLLAYDITTGALVTSFAPPALNAQGLGIAASPDGKTIYVVGDFTQVGTSTRNHIAAFNASTGALVTSFAANLSGEARAVTATASAVYVGGDFNYSGSVARTRLAAFSPTNGALLSWAPTADNGQVNAMTMAPGGSRVIVGGEFSTLNGQPASGMGSLDATTGAVQPWAITSAIQDGQADTRCGITNLSTDGTNIYGGGFAYGCGNFEGTFAANPTTGAVVWINDCHGDTYSTDPVGSVLYVASHEHDCSAIGAFPNDSAPGLNQRASAFTTAATGGVNTGPDAYGWNYAGQPDGTLLDWFPTLTPGNVTNQDQAAWSVTGNASYIAYGGEFPSVNGVDQQGLVRFAIRSLAPNKSGPIATTSSTTLTPTVSSTSYGTVNLSWTATWDRDNANLTYTILRDGTAVGTVTQASTFWQLPTLTYTDKGLTPGTTHTYRIRVTDPLGNSIGSGTSSPVTVSSAGGPPPNAAPTAAFTSSCAQLTCTFNGTGSKDSDGTVTAYAWNFGDGSTATGATTTHTYKTAGTRTVTLVVTDNSGANSTPVSHTVTPTAPKKAAVVAQDTFAKNVRSGWGKAQVGGTWSRAGCKAMSVTRKYGSIVAARSKACSAWLPSAVNSDTDTSVTLRAPSVPKGGLQVAVIGRRVSAADDIRLRLDLERDGRIAAALLRRVDNKTTALTRTVTIVPPSHTDGRVFVQLRVSGTSPTMIAAKIWPDGRTAPTAWTLHSTTTVRALQRKGALGFAAYLYPAHNPATASVRVSNFVSTVG